MVSPAEQHPSTIIEIRNEQGFVAAIDPRGAYLERLTAPDGAEVLFPRQKNEAGKDRGGIPVCAPIFGPGEEVGLRQHGFARDLEWEILESDESSARFSLVNPADQEPDLPDEYQGANMELSVWFLEADGGSGVRLQLSVENKGERAFIESSGLHPYLPVQQGTNASEYKVQYNDDPARHFSPEELAAVQRVPGRQTHNLARVAGPGGTWSMVTQGLPQLVAWSDKPGSYFCVEPTAAGPLATVDDQGARLLQPGERREYVMDLIWHWQED